MNKNLAKIIAITLCATTLSITTAPAYATSLKDFEEAQQSITMTVSKIPKDHVYIPKDTVLEIELVKAISSKTSKTGDPVELKTLDNIIINDVIVIPKGTRVNGVITKARGSGMFGRAGSLEFSINSVETINGVDIPLAYKGEESAGSDDGAIVVFAAVSILGGLFMKGKNVSCPEGTKMNARVTTNTDLGVTFENLAEAMSSTAPHGVSILLPH